LHNTGQQRLFGIVSNVWSKPIDDLPEMAIWKAGNIGSGHERLEGLEDLSK
jgi:hypothetical protein